MKRLATIFALFALAGCVNCYTRWPTTGDKITSVYQSTERATMISVVAAFPQIMSDNAGFSLAWMNLVSVPFMGLPCAVDVVFEAAADTICLPVDYPLSAARKGK